MKKKPKPEPVKKVLAKVHSVLKPKSKSQKEKEMAVFDTHKEKDEKTTPPAEPNGPGGPPKRELTKAEAEETLDRLHYCKKHGEKMEAGEHGAWHCKTDDAEQAAAEEKEAKEAWAVFSKDLPKGTK